MLHLQSAQQMLEALMSISVTLGITNLPQHKVYHPANAMIEDSDRCSFSEQPDILFHCSSTIFNLLLAGEDTSSSNSASAKGSSVRIEACKSSPGEAYRQQFILIYGNNRQRTHNTIQRHAYSISEQWTWNVNSTCCLHNGRLSSSKLEMQGLLSSCCMMGVNQLCARRSTSIILGYRDVKAEQKDALSNPSKANSKSSVQLE